MQTYIKTETGQKLIKKFWDLFEKGNSNSSVQERSHSQKKQFWRQA
jgi:hypothetical protein